MQISSRSNPKIKLARALRQRKARQETGLFLVEGIRHVGEAIEAGAVLEAILYAPDLLESPFAVDLVKEQSKRGIPCFATTTEVFTTLADKENPQGIIAVVHQPKHNLNDKNPHNFPQGVALVAPQDPGNIGTILRTIDAVGASGLLLLESSADPYHPGSVRASMGTLFWHPVICTSFAEFVRWAKGNAYHIYGTSAHGTVDYRQIKEYQSPCILLMGSEREGLSAEQRAVCECVIRLPMRGRATSLNLAVAAGVMLYAMMNLSSDQSEGDK